MRVIQVLDTIAYGDAISNHTIAIYQELNRLNIETYIYAKTVDVRLKKYVETIDSYNNLEQDIIIYHLSTGSELNRKIVEYKGEIIINYHNITPPSFFENYNKKIQSVVEQGYADTRFLADKINKVIVDSDYNGRELRKMGYKCPIFTVPIIMNFDDYKTTPSNRIIEKYKDGKTNIIFVGRVSPNKKQEDVIKDFYYYNNYINSNSRLIFVGNCNIFEGYYLKLKKYVKRLGLNNVIFTGHIHFDELLAYYTLADIFLCESEHEGFCVPLVESMYFNTPIIAFDSSAIGETLGDAGVLLKEKNSKLTSIVIDHIEKNKEDRSYLLEKQQNRLEYFKSDMHIKKIISIVTSKDEELKDEDRN